MDLDGVGKDTLDTPSSHSIRFYAKMTPSLRESSDSSFAALGGRRKIVLTPVQSCVVASLNIYILSKKMLISFLLFIYQMFQGLFLPFHHKKIMIWFQSTFIYKNI